MNKDLYGKQYKIPDSTLKHLKKYEANETIGNLLSTGNVFTEINLCEKDMTLIVGQNGAGKSTILDALSFVLFGKPFRKIKRMSTMSPSFSYSLIARTS